MRLILALLAATLGAETLTLPPGIHAGEWIWDSKQVICEPGAKIDGSVTLTGTASELRGCEVYQSSGPDRDAVTTFSPGSKIAGNYIHDTIGNCIGAWSVAANAMIEDNVLLYCGWLGSAHGIYAQSEHSKLIRRNSIMQYGWMGIHLYGVDGHLDNITLEGNTTAASGVWNVYGIVHGGAYLMTLNPAWLRHRSYFPATALNWPQGNNVGYIPGCTGGSITNSYFAGGFEPLEITGNCNPSQSGNTAFSLPGKKQANAIFAEPTSYGWLVTAFNWKGQSTVQITLPGAANGQQLKVASAEDPGVVRLIPYLQGKLTIPTSNWTMATPLRGAKPPMMLPTFGAFLVKQ